MVRFLFVRLFGMRTVLSSRPVCLSEQYLQRHRARLLMQIYLVRLVRRFGAQIRSSRYDERLSLSPSGWAPRARWGPWRLTAEASLPGQRLCNWPLPKRSGKLGLNQQRQGTWDRFEGEESKNSKQKFQAKMPHHYNCGCWCSQVHGNCTAAAFFFFLLA